jgi:hypothetical protein
LIFNQASRLGLRALACEKPIEVGERLEQRNAGRGGRATRRTAIPSTRRNSLAVGGERSAAGSFSRRGG